MNQKSVAVCLAIALGTAYTAGALAQAKPETLVKQRQAVMSLQGKYFGPLAGMAQGKIPYGRAQRQFPLGSVSDALGWI